MRVLVVDDDPSIRGMLELVFGIEGCEVHLAVDGRDGVDVARRVQPDVIVLDIMMPNMDGWEAARDLGGDPDTSGIPIVFCTVQADDESVWKGWRAGAASYMTKPFEIPALLDEIWRVTRPRTAPQMHPEFREPDEATDGGYGIEVGVAEPTPLRGS